MSADRFDEKSLLLKGFLPDEKGGYRPMSLEEKQQHKSGLFAKTEKLAPSTTEKRDIEVAPELRRVSIKLFGVPMPKQSVRAYATGRKNADTGSLIVDTFQPKKMTARVTDYRKQLQEQLPADFQMFTRRVHIRKLHFVYPPLKSFSKALMNRIAGGEIVFKESKPHLPDNLKKLPLDAMSGIVCKDDSIIVSEDDVKKYYGSGGIILID